MDSVKKNFFKASRYSYSIVSPDNLENSVVVSERTETCLFLMHLKKCGSESYLGSSFKSMGIVFPVEGVELLRNIESTASSPLSIYEECVIPVWLWKLCKEVY